MSSSSYSIKVEPGITYSFKVAAVNRGGESFSSEILSAYKAKREKGKVLIINGFNRLSGPATINTPDQAGFDLSTDPGVPYLYDISLCGTQKEFSRMDDATAFSDLKEYLSEVKIGFREIYDGEQMTVQFTVK